MNDFDPIRQYLAELATSLSSNKHPPERVLQEVEDHLRQRVDQLRAEGWEQAEAEREAIARFGTPLQVVDQFRQQPPLPCEEQIMFRRSIIALAALASAYAALHVGFSLFNEPTAIFTYVKIVYAVIIVGYGLLILHWQWLSHGIGDLERCAIFIGGLGLIEIGTANMVWTAHLGLVNGDWEFYGFVGGALISLLGAIAAIWLAFPNFPNMKREPQPIA